MAFRKIEDSELVGKGNMGQPDTPGVSTSEMQRIMDEIPREIIVPAFNELSDELTAETAAASLGAQVVEGLPEETPATVQGVMEALYSASKAGESNVSEALQDHAGNTSNPHNVTAAQTGAYTKAETDAAINEKVAQIGAGDMSKAVYDPTGQQKDIFAAISESAAGAMQKSDYASETPGAVNRAISADNGISTYTCATSGTTHALTGAGDNIKFVADAAYNEGDTITVNGTAVTAQTQDGAALVTGAWASGATVVCWLDGATLTVSGGGGDRVALLWTNSSPGTSFAGQTVSLNLSGYTHVLVKGKQASGNGFTSYVLVAVGESSSLSLPWQQSGKLWAYERAVIVSASGVQFGDGEDVTASSVSTNNNVMVPVKIWGVNMP